MGWRGVDSCVWCAVELSSVLVVGHVGVPPMTPTATFCEVHAACGPYPSENLDHEWSWVGVGDIGAVLLVGLLLTRRRSRK